MRKTMRKSALLSSVAMLIVSAIVLTSATYAWFTTAKTVTVDNLEVGVNAATGLLVSVNEGGTWLNQVNFTQNVNKVNRENWTAGFASDKLFVPVSTADGETWKKAEYDLDEGEFNVENALAGEHFLAVPFWVTGPAGKDVNYSINFFTVNENGEKIADTTAEALACIRFALADENGKLVGGRIVAGDEDTSYKGTSTLGTPTTAAGAYTVDGTEYTLLEQGDNIFTLKLSDDVAANENDADKYVAYLWLEGNDKDCDITLFQGKTHNIRFSMSLTLAE